MKWYMVCISVLQVMLGIKYMMSSNEIVGSVLISAIFIIGVISMSTQTIVNALKEVKNNVVKHEQ